MIIFICLTRENCNNVFDCDDVNMTSVAGV